MFQRLTFLGFWVHLILSIFLAVYGHENKSCSIWKINNKVDDSRDRTQL